MNRKLSYVIAALALLVVVVWVAFARVRAPALMPPNPEGSTAVVEALTARFTATWTPRPVDEPSLENPSPTETPSPLPKPSQTTDTLVSPSPPAPTASPGPPPPDPFELVSQETLFGFLEGLTAIQPYSGWRNSASQGEAEALDYVMQELGEYDFLALSGMELERQDFRVFLGTELWDTRLHLTVDGREVEVPADGLRGPRDDITQALRFDSDDALNDSTPDPQMVQGSVLLVRTPEEVSSLRNHDLQGRVVFLDYAAIDRVIQGGVNSAVGIASELLGNQPAGVVLVTQFSNERGQSHGTFVSDVSALNWVETDANPPILYARLEDLGPAGIHDWDDLERVESARLTWDADVFSPAASGNLVASIPGVDRTRAMILGAHIDSPNSPGAMDDGSGSAILLEIARILDASQTRPPTDLYLVWFGSEELGLYGSSHFVATHQELLDRTQAMLQTDMLSHPLDGIEADLALVTWSYGRLGDGRLLWPDHLIAVAGSHGVRATSEDVYHIYSDNSSFGGFGVPHADLIYQDRQAMEETGSLHYAAHIHDPYDTVELARQQGAVLEQMARVVLAAALETPPDSAALRTTPAQQHRAVFVGSHTESAHMTPAAFTDLGMTLAMEGYDVDLIPYGRPVTTEALANAELVIVLPVVDYPSPETNLDLYDESWSAEEISALQTYANEGGLLVLTNSANRIKYSNRVLDPNEDWNDMNSLASQFGFSYEDGFVTRSQAVATTEHPLMKGITVMASIPGNGVPIGFDETGPVLVLAETEGNPVIALADYGTAGGQVLVLADVGLLGSSGGPPENLPFWQNLARYARD